MKRVFCRYFTLVELLTVIAVIGILAAIGFGTYSTAQNKSRISATKSLIENVANAFEAAKAEVGYIPAATNWTELEFGTENINSTDYYTLTNLGDNKFKKAFAKNLDAEMVQKFLNDNQLIDSWGTTIYYRYPGIANKAKCTLISAGPDGKFGTGSGSTTPPDSVSNYKSSGEWACDDVANF